MRSMVITIQGDMPFQVVMKGFKAMDIVFHLTDDGAEHLGDKVFTAESKSGSYLVQLSRIDDAECGPDELAGTCRSAGQIQRKGNRAAAPKELHKPVYAAGIAATFL